MNSRMIFQPQSWKHPASRSPRLALSFSLSLAVLMSALAFKGTSVEQDPRWQKLQAKRKKGIKFPAIFQQKVDMSKVNREQMKRWTSERLVSLFDGLEDEVLINYVGAHLDQPSIDPEELLLSLNDMLERDAASFCEELWTLLVDAQNQPGGIPKALLQTVKAQVDTRMQEKDRVAQGMRHMGHSNRNQPPAHHNSDSSRKYGMQRGDHNREKYIDRRDDRKRDEEDGYERKFEKRERYDAPRLRYDDRERQYEEYERREYRGEYDSHRSRQEDEQPARREENVSLPIRSRYDPVDADIARQPPRMEERERYQEQYGRYEQAHDGDRRHGRDGRHRRHREFDDYDTPYSRSERRYEDENPGADPFGRDARPAPPKQNAASSPRHY